MDVLLAWPVAELPALCVKTGRPTASRLLVAPRGTGRRTLRAAAPVSVPLSASALSQWRALHRVRLGASAMTAIALVLLALGTGPRPVLLAVTLAAAAVTAFAWSQELRARFDVRLSADQLLIAHVHPAFAAACSPAGNACSHECAGCVSACVLAEPGTAPA